MHRPLLVVIQEANSGLVQKVQPNDKSGKLLPNDHTKGAQESTGTPYVKVRAASRQTKGSRGSLARPPTGGRRSRAHAPAVAHRLPKAPTARGHAGGVAGPSADGEA